MLESWQLKSFSDLCTLRKESVDPDSCPEALYVGLEHIDSGCASLRRWGVASLVRSAKSKFYVDDVLYGKLRPYLDKVVISEFEGICSTDILVFTPKNGISSTFLAYFMHSSSFKAYAVKTMRGVNHPRTSWSSLGEYSCEVPLEPEQEAIAKILRKVERAREAREQELSLELEHKNLLMDQVFSQGLHNERLKQTEIGDIPKSWDLEPLGPMVSMNNGINFKKEQRGSGTLTVDVLNMYTDSIYLNTDKLYRVDIPLHENDLLQPNELLFVRSSLKQEGVGWPALFPGHNEPVAFCGFIIRARLNDERVLPEFLVNYLRLPKTRRLLVSKSGKVAITNVNQGNIASLPIPIPSPEEQQEIADIARAFDTKISALNQEIKLLDELFNALLDELMSGKLSVAPLLVDSQKVPALV